MLKVVGVLNTGEPVKGIIVNPHGVEVPEHVFWILTTSPTAASDMSNAPGRRTIP